MANEADLKLIQIPEFPKTETLVGSGPEYVVLTKADGVTYGMLTEDFKAFLGTVQVQVPKALAPTDPAPTLSGVYYPTVTQNEAGTPIVYANAGGIEVNTAEEGEDYGKAIQLIKDNEGGWSKISTPMPIQDVSSIYYTISDFKNNVGVLEVPASTEFAQDLKTSDIEDENVWLDGYINTNGSISNTPVIKHTKQYYPIVGGHEYNFNLGIYGNASIAFYDADKVFISSNSRGGATSYTFWNVDIEVPESARYYRTSHTYGQPAVPVSGISIKNKLPLNSVTSDVFLQTDEVVNRISAELGNYGFDRIPPGVNSLQELTTAPLEEGEVWGRGFLNASFQIDPLLRRWHTKKYYEIVGGNTYNFRLYANQAAKIVFYDKNKYPMSYASGTGSPGTWVGEMITPEGAKYLRVSHDYEASADLTKNIYFQNKNDIYLSPSTDFDLVEIYKREYPPKKRVPIVSIVADDCYEQNDWFIDILNNKGVKGTFAVVRDWTDTAGFLTTSQLLELHENGHELANHTMTHQRTGELTEAEQYEEVYRNYVFLQKLTGYVPTFVAPFSNQTEVTERIVRQFHKVAVQSRYTKDSTTPIENAINLPPIDKYRATRVSYDATENGISLLQLGKDAIDEAILKGGWVIFAIHPQFTEYYSGSGGLGRRQEISDLIDYAISLNVEILTVRDALTIYDNPKTVGNFRLDTRYWELGMDGSTKGSL